MSLERGLCVIKCFGENRPQLTLSEVAGAAGLTRAAARRFLITLQALGYVENEGRYFRLRPSTLELGYAYLASQPWWRPAQRIAEHLGAALRQACAVGVLDRDSVAYVAYAPAVHLPALTRSIGTRLPAYATAIGRVLLAGQPDAERAGYLKTVKLLALTPFTVSDRAALRKAVEQAGASGFSIVDQELEIGLRSISVPIRRPDGRVMAALNVSTHAGRVEIAEMTERFLPHLREAADRITGLARSIGT